MKNFHYYDANGMGTNNPNEFWNGINVPLASPIGIAVLDTQINLYSTIKAGRKQSRLHFKGVKK